MRQSVNEEPLQTGPAPVISTTTLTTKEAELLSELRNTECNSESLKEKEPNFSVSVCGPVPDIHIADSTSRYELPPGYGDTKIVLLIRDPYWIYTYWEIADDTKEAARNAVGPGVFSESKTIIRIYELRDQSESLGPYFDVPISNDTMSWYINVPKDDTGYIAEIGYLTANNQFLMMARSNLVFTPPASISNVLDEEWMTLDEDFFRLYKRGIALSLSGSEEIIRSARGISLALEKEMGSGAISSLSSPYGIKQQWPNKFWLVLNAELILYGQTEPDAYVTLGGKQIELRADGSFRTQFALPDGEYTLPVEATSSCGSHRIVITPVITRETH